MRYKIKHITEYKYNASVSHCYNLAHMIPRESRRQKRISSQVSVTPVAGATSTREDYFGNSAYHFEIQRPHKKLVISSSCEVETQPQDGNVTLDLGVTCAEALLHLMQSDHAELLFAKEYLLNSPMIHVTEALRDYAAPSFDFDRPLLSCVMDLTKRIYSDFTYSPESTTVATPLSEVLETRKGVCQDFAHLQIACLRAMGYPAKYVSGYIETLPPPGQEKLVGTDATHAWISVYSPKEGWFEFDPTNQCLAGEQHIITAWGRDYFDVTPLRGVIYGGGDNPLLSVSVDVARAS